ncbi:MAG: hypothetical protein JXL97_13755 [Bacteroidales bacterium]|nr:hypothetical protein [Bacteroidales bacterium]
MVSPINPYRKVNKGRNDNFNRHLKSEELLTKYEKYSSTNVLDNNEPIILSEKRKKEIAEKTKHENLVGYVKILLTTLVIVFLVILIVIVHNLFFS